MEAQWQAVYLLTLRAVVMIDQKQPNSLEASMCKAKAGKAITFITQKAVELLGPMGYTREWLVEKWMRGVVGREVDARWQDQRHLRRHRSDQHIDRSTADFGLFPA